MAVVKLSQIERFIGTAAEMLLYDTTGIPVGSTFFQSDTGKMFALEPAGTWSEKKQAVGESTLPTGASTEAKQDDVIGALEDIRDVDGIKKITDTVNVSLEANDIDDSDAPAKLTAMQDINGKAILRTIDENAVETLGSYFGEMAESPTAYTLFARLKAIESKLAEMEVETNVIINGSKLMEQLTEDDVAVDELTFSDDIETIEIYNLDTVNDGTFTVNGIDILVPTGEVYKAKIGGVPSAVVTIVDSTEYIVSRYI